jgi:hypothetical protein
MNGQVILTFPKSCLIYSITSKEQKEFKAHF